MTLTVLRELAGCYLVLTLAATGIAKLRMLRGTSVGLMLEGVVPRRMAMGTVVAVASLELLLSVFLVSRQFPQLAGLATAALFLGFAVYRISVAVKTGWVSCSCSGRSVAYKATRPAITAAIMASLIQAALACVWAFLPSREEMVFRLIIVGAFAIPIAAFLKGICKSDLIVNRINTTTTTRPTRTYTTPVRE